MAAFHDRGEDVGVTVRNDFGQTEEIRASFFFRTEDAFEEWESIALRRCGPRVLDIGAGVGAHALVLQARGHEVTALDVIPEAVQIMRERGVEDAREGALLSGTVRASIRHGDPPHERLDDRGDLVGSRSPARGCGHGARAWGGAHSRLHRLAR